MSVLVYLGGEGRCELGSRDGDRAYQTDEQPGVIVALAARAERSGWEVCGATKWSRITKLKARGPAPAEARNIAGLVLDAREAGANLLLFLRDEDDDADRTPQIEAAVELARKEHPDLLVVGGLPRRNLEAWILALAGARGVEALGRKGIDELLVQRGIGLAKDVAEYVEVVEACAHPGAADAPRLTSWLDAVGEGLREAMAERSRAAAPPSDK